MNIEAEVKGILDYGRAGVKITNNGIANFIEYSISTEGLARQILHLFPKTPDNPGGYEVKPDNTLGMNITEATARACGEPSLLEALTFICVWESERVVKQARANDQWETCFKVSLESVMDNYKPKPDESRLLVSLHNLILTICEDKYAVPEMMAERITKEVDDYIAKTASIKDTECQARVKKIFKEIEKRQLSEKLERDAVPGMIIISNVQWEALKKEEEGL